MSSICTKAPDGWRCTRRGGHTGPCAAEPVTYFGTKHPDAPMFPRRREYRINRCATAVPQRWLFRVEYKTWLTRRWKTCSHYYDTLLDAQAELRAIRFGLPGWVPVE